MSRYYVWVNRGTEARPVPLQSEGYQGPYALATATQYARIAASKGQYGRIVSSNTDPHALQVVRAYPAGMRAQAATPNGEHFENLALLLAPRGGVPFIGDERSKGERAGIARFDSPHGSRRYVMLDRGEPVAAAQFVEIEPGVLKLANVFVVAELRRRGLARALVARAMLDFRVVLPADEEDRSQAGDAMSRAVFGRNGRLPASIERSRWATPNARDLPAWMDYQERYIKEHWPDAKLLGYGSNGTAWDVGDHVVKYTISDEEIGVLQYLMEEDIGGFTPQVFSITQVDAAELPDLGGFVIEREPAEPVLQAFQTRSRRDQASLRRLLAALEQADDAPTRKTVLSVADKAESVDGGEGFASALRELWARGMVVHDIRADNLGVTGDGRIVVYDPGWLEAV